MRCLPLLLNHCWSERDMSGGRWQTLDIPPVQGINIVLPLNSVHQEVSSSSFQSCWSKSNLEWSQVADFEHRHRCKASTLTYHQTGRIKLSLADQSDLSDGRSQTIGPTHGGKATSTYHQAAGIKLNLADQRDLKWWQVADFGHPHRCKASTLTYSQTTRIKLSIADQRIWMVAGYRLLGHSTVAMQHRPSTRQRASKGVFFSFWTVWVERVKTEFYRWTWLQNYRGDWHISSCRQSHTLSTATSHSKE